MFRDRNRQIFPSEIFLGHVPFDRRRIRGRRLVALYNSAIKILAPRVIDRTADLCDDKRVFLRSYFYGDASFSLGIVLSRDINMYEREIIISL